MKPDTYLHVVALATGSSFRSSRPVRGPLEGPPDQLEADCELLELALHQGPQRLPGGERFVAMAFGGHCLLASILLEDGTPIVRLGVALHSRCGAALWRVVAPIPGAPKKPTPCPPEPWCAVYHDPEAFWPASPGAGVVDLACRLGWAALILRERTRAK